MAKYYHSEYSHVTTGSLVYSAPDGGEVRAIVLTEAKGKRSWRHADGSGVHTLYAYRPATDDEVAAADAHWEAYRALDKSHHETAWQMWFGVYNVRGPRPLDAVA